MSAISGLLSSLKVSTDLLKALLGIRDANLVREKAVELTGVIMDAQTSALAAQAAQSELTERVRALEKQVVELENWDRERQRYELAEVGVGTFAYATKPGMENGEPAHRICAGCYQQGRKSILQGFSRTKGMQTTNFLRCDACQAEIITKTITHPFPTMPRPGPRWLD